MSLLDQIDPLLAGAGTLVTVLGLTVLSLFRRRAGSDSALADAVTERMLKLLAGKDADSTPKEIGDSTGLIRMVMRAELEQDRAEQRRQGRLLEEQGAKIEVLAENDIAERRSRHELSDRVAVLERESKVRVLKQRLDGDERGQAAAEGGS